MSVKTDQDSIPSSLSHAAANEDFTATTRLMRITHGATAIGLFS